MNASRLMRLRMAIGVALTSALLCAGAAAFAGPAAAASPWWLLDVQSAPTNLPPGGEGEILVHATNVGNGNVNGSGNPVWIRDHVPAGLKITNIGAYAAAGMNLKTKVPNTSLNCTVTPQGSGNLVSCPYTGVLQPYEEMYVEIFVKVTEPSGTVTTLPDEAQIEGGGTPRSVLQPHSLSQRRADQIRRRKLPADSRRRRRLPRRPGGIPPLPADDRLRPQPDL